MPGAGAGIDEIDQLSGGNAGLSGHARRNGKQWNRKDTREVTSAGQATMGWHLNWLVD
jgi:hypothetical protein